MYRSYFFCFLLFTLAVPALYASQDAAAPERDMDPVGTPSGVDFVLQSAAGPVSTREFRGKAILLYFGYTKCPDVCPTSLALITQALNELSGDELKGITSLFVSVDPKRDTPASLAAYVDYFHENFIGVTGTPQQVADVAKLYGVEYYEVTLEGSAFGYAVNHSSDIYLIDQTGELRFVFPHGTPASMLLEGIRYVQGDK